MNTSGYRFVLLLAVLMSTPLLARLPLESHHQTQTVRFHVKGGVVYFMATVNGTVANGKTVTPVECVLDGRFYLVETGYTLVATAVCTKFGTGLIPGVVPQVVLFDGINRDDAIYEDGVLKASLPRSAAGGAWLSVMMVPLSYPGHRFVNAPIQVGEFSKSLLELE